MIIRRSALATVLSLVVLLITALLPFNLLTFSGLALIGLAVVVAACGLLICLSLPDRGSRVALIVLAASLILHGLASWQFRPDAAITGVVAVASLAGGRMASPRAPRLVAAFALALVGLVVVQWLTSSSDYLQHLPGTEAPIDYTGQETFRSPGTFGHPLPVQAWLGAIAAGAFAYFAEARRVLYCLAVLVLALLVSVSTGSRSGPLILAGTLVLAATFRPALLDGLLRSRRQVGLGVAVASLGLAGTILARPWDDGGLRVLDYGRLLTSDSYAVRSSAVQLANQATADIPCDLACLAFGHGFRFLTGRFLAGGGPTDLSATVDNWYVTSFVDLGLASVLVLLSLVGLAVVRLRDSSSRYQAAGATIFLYMAMYAMIFDLFYNHALVALAGFALGHATRDTLSP